MSRQMTLTAFHKSKTLDNKYDGRKGELSAEVSNMGTSDRDQALDAHISGERAAYLEDLDEVPTFAIHDNSSLPTGSSRQFSSKEMATTEPTELHEAPHSSEHDEVLMNGNVKSPESRRINVAEKHGGKGSFHVGNKSFGFAQINQDNNFPKMSVTSGDNDISRFSDTPGDATLDDLFHPLDKNLEDQAAEASTSASTSHMSHGISSVTDAGKNDLATKLRATIAQKQMENEMGQANGGSDVLRLMMGVLKDGVIDIGGLVFDEKLAGENLFPLQVFVLEIPSLEENFSTAYAVTTFEQFLSMPARGILQSLTGLITGMAQGSSSLLSNTVYAISDATQFSKAAQKGIVAFTFDDQAVSRVKMQQMSAASHSKGVINEVLEELTPITSLKLIEYDSTNTVLFLGLNDEIKGLLKWLIIEIMVFWFLKWVIIGAMVLLIPSFLSISHGVVLRKVWGFLASLVLQKIWGSFRGAATVLMQKAWNFASRKKV